MASLRVHLLDEAEQPVRVITVEDERSYAVNDHFSAPDGGVYLISAVEEGARPGDLELTGVWIDGPHPGRG